MNTINLTLGDWSADGHGKTDTITISSSLTAKQLEAAYKRGCKKIGFDLTEEVAEQYENSILEEEVAEKLRAAGFKVEDIVGTYEGELDNLCVESFVVIWLFIVKLAKPDFEYKIINNADIKIGGYGLFGS